MITQSDKTGFLKNECFVIVNSRNCVVDYTTFKNSRRKSYFYSNRDNPPNSESQFETLKDAVNALSKCTREGTVKKLIFDNEDFSSSYNGEGANILGYDFLNERIWIQSKTDEKKYGYDYRYMNLVELI